MPFWRPPARPRPVGVYGLLDLIDHAKLRLIELGMPSLFEREIPVFHNPLIRLSCVYFSHVKNRDRLRAPFESCRLLTFVPARDPGSIKNLATIDKALLTERIDEHA